MVSAAIIIFFTTVEFIDYRRVHMDTSLLVDRSRGEKLNVLINVTFPRVPCYCKCLVSVLVCGGPKFTLHNASSVVSVDVTDISGELQTDLTHNILKTRLNQDGTRAQAPTANGPCYS